MAKEGCYYIFQPPFSNTEYFVKVTDVKINQEDQNRYVHYKHILNDMDGSYEQSHFNQGSHQLTSEKIKNIIKNISEEIDQLEEKMSDFNEVLKKIKKDKNDIGNVNQNGERGDVKEKDITRVENNN